MEILYLYIRIHMGKKRLKRGDKVHLDAFNIIYVPFSVFYYKTLWDLNRFSINFYIIFMILAINREKMRVTFWNARGINILPF